MLAFLTLFFWTLHVIYDWIFPAEKLLLVVLFATYAESRINYQKLYLSLMSTIIMACDTK